jgi:hypothetical protein
MAAYEFMALDEAGLKLLAPGPADTYVANRAVHFTANITTDSLIDGRDVAADGALAVSAVQPGDNISTLTNDTGFTDDQTGAEIKTLYEAEASAFTDALFTKLSAIESLATADQTNAEIKTAYETATPLVSQAAAEAGVATDIEAWSPYRVKQAITANINSPKYGVLSTQTNTTGETTVDATPRKITAWNTNGINDGVTVDAANDHLKILTAGVYIVFANLSFSGTASKTYQIEIYKNGLTTGFATDRKLGTGGDVGSCSMLGIMQCAVNDTIELYQYSSDGGSAMVVTEAQLGVNRNSL